MSRARLRPLPSCAVAAGLLLATVPAPAPAAATASRAQVRSVDVTPDLVRVGAPVTITSRGRGPVTFSLSADRRADARDPRLGRRELRRPRVRTKLRVPKATPLGAYHVIACPGRARRGCRASKQRVAVMPRPRPAAVVPSPDAARAAGTEIGREGGTLSATGADGTVYTLTVPAGALLDPATITLTPVASIAGLPAGATGAKAVEIGPAGRRLLRPATLSIATQALPPRAALTGFGFGSGGRGFHLVPATHGGQAATVRIFALRGRGIAAAPPAARRTFALTRLPKDLVDQLEQVAAAPRAARRARAAQEGPRDELSAMIFALFLSTQSLAQTGAVDDAVLQFVPWEAISAGAAGRYPEIAGWRALLAGAFGSGIRQQIGAASAACLGGKDIAQMGRLLRYRDYLYTSLATLPVQSERSAIDAALGRCLRFELDYEVAISGVNSYEEGTSARVSSTVPVRMLTAGDTSHFLGDAALTVGDYTVGPAGCWTHTWNVTPAERFSVTRMSVAIRRERGAETLPADIRVTFKLGSLDEKVTHVCDGDPGSSYTDTQHAYDGVAAALLGGPAGSEFELSWTSGASGGAYSSQSFTRSSDAGGRYTGTLTFRLRHEPS